jgi:hypothetical protein
MTDERMALAELLQKSGDGDFLRSVAKAVLQILMERSPQARFSYPTDDSVAYEVHHMSFKF